MSGLIEEIQRYAADQHAPIDVTLRKVKLAAAKLQLGTLESWVADELNGYKGEVPEYRRLHGQPAAWNPYNGWVPIYSDDERLLEIISAVPIQQSIGSLVDALASHKSGTLDFPLPPVLVVELNKYLNFRTTRVVIKLGRGHVFSIPEAVRNMVLDWSIKMEARGVMGKGLSFTPKEKTEAKRTMTTINIGRIDNFAGNLGVDQVARDVTLTTESKADLKALANELEASFENFVAIGPRNRHFVTRWMHSSRKRAARRQ